MADQLSKRSPQELGGCNRCWPSTTYTIWVLAIMAPVETGAAIRAPSSAQIWRCLPGPRWSCQWHLSRKVTNACLLIGNYADRARSWNSDALSVHFPNKV